MRPGSTAWRCASDSANAFAQRVNLRPRAARRGRGSRSARWPRKETRLALARAEEQAAGAGPAADGAWNSSADEGDEHALHASAPTLQAATLQASTLQASTLHAATRRELLLGSGVLFAWVFMPRVARAEGRDPRFLTIVCAARSTGSPPSPRSAIPIGSSCAATMRWRSTARRPRYRSTASFALNPAMPNVHRLYQAGQATIVHAVATPHRDRSHFDGQDVLESGAAEAWCRRYRLAQPGACRAGAGRGGQCARPARLRGRTSDAAGGARSRAGHVMDAAARAAGQRGDHAAAPRPLSPYRSDLGARA